MSAVYSILGMWLVAVVVIFAIGLGFGCKEKEEK